MVPPVRALRKRAPPQAKERASKSAKRRAMDVSAGEGRSATLGAPMRKLRITALWYSGPSLLFL
jgi:hypothetical protein